MFSSNHPKIQSSGLSRCIPQYAGEGELFIHPNHPHFAFNISRNYFGSPSGLEYFSNLINIGILKLE